MRLLRALLAAVALMVVVVAPAQAASTARADYPVTVLSSGRITFSGDSGGVPITVENTSSSPVTVTIELVGYPSSRLDSDPLQGIIVDPGMRTSVEIEARIIGDGPLNAGSALLLKPESAWPYRPRSPWLPLRMPVSPAG